MNNILISLMLLSMMAEAAWTPPEKPNPSPIFRDAQADAKGGHFEDALAKHLWFHQHALEIEPAQYGVRLSFALAAWRDLAAKYPPAMEALRKTRDDAESSVRSGAGDFEPFHDAIGINMVLHENERSVALFKWVSEHNSPFAKRALKVAEPLLVAAKEYALCGKYLEPGADYDALVMIYREQLKMSQQKRFETMKDFGERKFSCDVGTLVALLVLNDRKDEALAIRDKAASEWDAKQFRDLLDRALKGEFPPPFPPNEL